MTTPLRWTAAFVSGLSLAFAFAPYDIGVLAWVSLSLLIGAAVGVRPRAGFLYGWAHGVTFFSVSLSWIYTVMHVHGGMEPPLAAAVFLLLIAVLAVCPGLFGAGVAWCGRRSVTRACLAVPFLWVVTELLRRYELGLGFPWNLLGYAAAVHLGLLQLVTITGVYGLSFVLAASNALVAWVLLTRTRSAWLTGLISGAVIVSAVLVGDQFVPLEQPEYDAVLVQTNFPQSTSYPADWLDRHSAELDELETMSADAERRTHGVVIWPESPAPFYWQDPRFAARLSRLALTMGNNLIVGVVDWKPGPNGGTLEPYNTAILVDPAGHRVFSYDKIELVPFGEFIPWRRWLTFANTIIAEVGEFHPGKQFSVGELPGGRFSVFICYEAVIPDAVRQFARRGARLFINLSNDGWFGRSAALEQHLAQVRVRAVENRRWILRATNTGLTVSIGPYGRVVAAIPPDRRAVLIAPYAFRDDITIYTRFGDWLGWLSILVSLWFLIYSGHHPEDDEESAEPEEEPEPVPA
ncbi:MAG TPA: apolipoprotein N-acyltransferase [Candidatus Acidoferrales bacterium]|nr:apolipoprotein N-acyltransferase [Candidatus Acidoferrales bacterium]